MQANTAECYSSHPEGGGMEKMQYEDQLQLLDRGEPGEILDLLLKLSQKSPMILFYLIITRKYPFHLPLKCSISLATP